ncbi:MAG TPA: SAM-dependent methyltransferase [Candidatus Acidoferrum sp.]|nr:SAM-dependent methyltransferase [Candidatus Acidoferrum sp.]
MRLDSYLVKNGFTSSRTRAKWAVKNGLVRINGEISIKPSLNVKFEDKVIVSKSANKPVGYWKLKKLQEEFNLIRPDDVVLDIGSSAGGFLLCASEIAKRVYGIEFSLEFRCLLNSIEEESEGRIKVIYGDAFSFDFKKELQECVDLILNDVTTEPEESFKVLERSVDVLKGGGRVLQVFKMKTEDMRIGGLIERLTAMGLKILYSTTSGKDEHYIVVKK